MFTGLRPGEKLEETLFGADERRSRPPRRSCSWLAQPDAPVGSHSGPSTRTWRRWRPPAATTSSAANSDTRGPARLHRMIGRFAGRAPALDHPLHRLLRRRGRPPRAGIAGGHPSPLWGAARGLGLLAPARPADRLDWAVFAAWSSTPRSASWRDRTESLGTLALATAYAAWFCSCGGGDYGRHRRRRRHRPRGHARVQRLALVRRRSTGSPPSGRAVRGLITFPWESVNALPVLVLLAVPFVASLGASDFRIVLVRWSPSERRRPRSDQSRSGRISRPRYRGPRRRTWRPDSAGAGCDAASSPAAHGRPGLSAPILAQAVLIGPRLVESSAHRAAAALGAGHQYDRRLAIYGTGRASIHGSAWNPPTAADLLAVSLPHTFRSRTLIHPPAPSL